MQDELPAVGAYGCGASVSGPKSEFVVASGRGAGLPRAFESSGVGACGW
ncbi:MAG: hypothetical protein JRN56_05450 [Nitrososphaerota archaeon]|nr:hypothetical protein [Nitrososphaerota archaeon]MDG7003330.1 hypothetical protein [Nitrososphaerota archaeon]MDG7029743.1 hypothetical protein [Nitrososphaerota archaeon]MDG7032515.1 hypothetical protein [Nitrososphaerota archaeon]MDG7034465.1 hypothetical protein [Nitrososphaerota archaeon]